MRKNPPYCAQFPRKLRARIMRVSPPHCTQFTRKSRARIMRVNPPYCAQFTRKWRTHHARKSTILRADYARVTLDWKYYTLVRVLTPYPCSSSFLVHPEVESIHAVANSVTLDPLVSIVSSLSRAFDDDCAVAEVNLEPLTPVVITCDPWAEFWTTAHGIYPALIGCVMRIVDRRRSECDVG